ncbi:MAG: DUF5698 domain-containing protein [Clostridia bacterium]
MNEFFLKLTEFASGSTIWVYLFIFFGKFAEVVAATVRIVLINRGERLMGGIIAFFEMLLWLIVTGCVLVGYQEDVFKILVFSFAFASGNYFGSRLEERLAFGLCSVQAIVMTQDESYLLAKALRKEGFGVSQLIIQGLDDQHYMLLTTIKRKLANEALSIIQKAVPSAVVTVSDVKTQKGGYLRSSATRRARRITK